ncbi:MAG: hypothetical protein CVV24_04820 [Ignavibacteriae bacterium HGW-Ignavibacteriae-3]|nr:MAG: hypothetical protein CVV24_04820 [Ignavibacteriae bacterium HGW-Ignavibacteriae-3]
MKRKIQIFFFIYLFSTCIFAQSGRDSLNFSVLSFGDRQLTSNFDKQLNTYTLNTIAKYFLSYDKFFFGIRENFNSTVTRSSIINIKDEQYLSAIGQYSISDQFKFGILLNNNFYADDRIIEINQASLLTTSLFAKILPFRNIVITPYGGVSQNKQIGKKDNGYIYGAEAAIDKFNMGDFDLSSTMKFQNEDVSPRKNTLRLTNFDITSEFEESFINTVSVYYSEQKKDFYFIADPATAAQFNITNNIQSRTESNYFLQDKIKFSTPNSPLSLDLQGRVSWRDINRNTRYLSFSNIANSNYDTRIEEFRLDFSSAADYLTRDLRLAFRFSFSEKNEKHQPNRSDAINNIILNERESLEQQKNNSSQLANISILSRIALSDRDYLTVSLFHRKLRYDTPSDLNFDDRDELLSIGRILYEKEINPFFKIFLNLEGSLNKIVYIFAERSSNNNLRRILKFSSGGVFNTGRFTSSNSAEVSANYTVFDYEELNPNFRSYSFRQFVLRDSSGYQFSSKLRLFISGYLKLSEQGDFRWSDFSSRPSRYLDELYAEPKFFYDYRSLSVGLGIRYFSLSTFNYKNGVGKLLASDYNSIGPVAELSYLIAEKINIKLYGWYEFIKSEDSSKREMANLNVRVNYRF